MNKHFTFKEYMAKLMQTLNRRNGLLPKLRHQISSDLLKTIYFALFDPLSYALCSIGIDQRSSNIAGMIQKTQNKALKIINLKEKAELSDLFYTNHKILKLQISIHWTISYLSISYVITYQTLSQIVSRYFLKISTAQA